MGQETRERPVIIQREKERIHRWFSPGTPVYFGADQEAPHWALIRGRFRAQADKEEVYGGRLSEVSPWRVNNVEEAILYRDEEERELLRGQEVYLFNRDARRKGKKGMRLRKAKRQERKAATTQKRLPKF